MLQHNRIGDAGAAAIAQAVRGNVASKLTLLDLSENPLSAEKGAAGGKALAHMAQVSVTTCKCSDISPCLDSTAYFIFVFFV